MWTRWVSFACAALLGLAVLDLPYGYYTFLRWAVCAAALILLGIEQRTHKTNLWVVGYAIIAILFNPIVPIHLARGTWLPIDLACAAFFVTHAIRNWRSGEDA